MYFCAKVGVMANYKELEWLDERRKFRKVERWRRFGIKKSSGDLLTKIKYVSISPFVDSVAVVRYRRFYFTEILWGFVTAERKEILFDKNCRKVVVLNKDVIAVKLQVDEEKYEWAIFNSDGVEPYGIRYDKCPAPYVNGRSKVRFRGKYTFLNEMGRQICGAYYDDAADFRKNGRAFVWIRGTRYILRKDGIEDHVNMKRI